jgi:spermidine synthase
MGLRRGVFVGAYAASGAAALIYEVAWTRLLTLHLGHTVAAASTVLAAFMGGLAIGA